LRRVVVVIVVVTGGEQGRNSISNAVKREITQGLQEGHGMDKGIAVACTSQVQFFDFKTFDFETCEEIDLSYKSVRCMAC
jgi:hypothetical protein